MYWSKSTSSSAIPKIFFIFGIVWTTYTVKSTESKQSKEESEEQRRGWYTLLTKNPEKSWAASLKCQLMLLEADGRFGYQPSNLPLNIANWKVFPHFSKSKAKRKKNRWDYLKITYKRGLLFILWPLCTKKERNNEGWNRILWSQVYSQRSIASQALSLFYNSTELANMEEYILQTQQNIYTTE